MVSLIINSVRYPAPPLLREDGDGPCKFRNPIVQPTILLVCKQDRTLLFSIKALCLVGAVSCLQLSKPYHCMNKDKSIFTFITSISLRGYITLFISLDVLKIHNCRNIKNYIALIVFLLLWIFWLFIKTLFRNACMNGQPPTDRSATVYRPKPMLDILLTTDILFSSTNHGTIGMHMNASNFANT